MKKKIPIAILIALLLVLFALYSPFTIYKSNFNTSTKRNLSFTMFKMEGNIKELNPAGYQLLHEQIDYLTIDNLNEIPILINETGNSSNIWALIYQKSNFTNQFEIELPLKAIAYQGKLMSLKASGNITIKGELEVLGLCSLKQYRELLEEKLKNELLEGFKQEVKKKIEFDR